MFADQTIRKIVWTVKAHALLLKGENNAPGELKNSTTKHSHYEFLALTTLCLTEMNALLTSVGVNYEMHNIKTSD